MGASEPVYLITGASRGLGLALVTELLAKPGGKVIAGARNPAKSEALQSLAAQHPDRLILVALDVASEDSIKAAVAEVEAALPEGGGIDVLINNAGIASASGFAGFPDTKREYLLETFQTNVLGSWTLAAELLPLLRRGELRRIVNVSSGQGSISDAAADAGALHGMGGVGAAYRISKAALNMATANMANNLKKEGFIVIAQCPGWVQTDMGNRGGQFAKSMGLNVGPNLTPSQSATAQLEIIDKLTPSQNGKFFNHEGKERAW